MDRAAAAPFSAFHKGVTSCFSHARGTRCPRRIRPASAEPPRTGRDVPVDSCHGTFSTCSLALSACGRPVVHDLFVLRFLPGLRAFRKGREYTACRVGKMGERTAVKKEAGGVAAPPVESGGIGGIGSR